MREDLEEFMRTECHVMHCDDSNRVVDIVTPTELLGCALGALTFRYLCNTAT